MKKTAPLALLALLPALFVGNASAAVLADYMFAGSTDDVTTVNSDVSATSLSIGNSNTAFGTIGDTNTGNGWGTTGIVNNAGAAAAPSIRFLRVGQVTGTESDAVTANDYFEFTITPDSGFSMGLDTLEMDIAATTGTGTIALTWVNTSHWFVRTSLDSFGTTVGSVSVSHTGGGTSNYSHASISFSGGAYEALTAPTTFRLYNYSVATGGTLANQNSFVNRIDNIQLTGDVSTIPEPSHYALIFGAASALVLVGRKHRTSKAPLAKA